MQQKSRILFIDNFKFSRYYTCRFNACRGHYSGIGSWYYKEQPEQGLISMLCFFVFQTFSQAFSMGLMFLLAGYFTSVSYEQKGCTKFIRDRIIRLGVPTLLYMLAIHPLLLN